MWKTVKLGDVLKTGAGGTPLKSKKEYYEDGNIKWLLSGAVCERDILDSKTHITEEGLANSSAKLFPRDTVLVAMYGATAGQVGILRTEAATNQAVCGIYPSSDYLPEFLYYYLSNYKETLLLEVSGVAQPNLSQIKIKNIPLPIIPLAEQQRIVAKLDAAFAEIDSAIKLVEAKEANVERLKASLLDVSLKGDDFLWKTVKLGDVATVIAGQSPKGEHYNKEGRGTPFYQGKKDYGETYLNEPTVWTEVVTKLAEKDDILMSVRAPVGALNIAMQKICIGRGLAAIRPSTEILHDYLFYSLLLISHQLEGSAGAIFNSINKAQIEAIEFPLPPLAEQQRIVAKLDAAFAEIDTVFATTTLAKENYITLKSVILAQELQPPQSEAA